MSIFSPWVIAQKAALFLLVGMLLLSVPTAMAQKKQDGGDKGQADKTEAGQGEKKEAEKTTRPKREPIEPREEIQSRETIQPRS